ncbi:unnamed protein product [Nippostrongylus brasiliensis]|uniref:Uncharacterized protein n=1 Tax=Nippostrongylus brasiliensis TaxID=27835 RepID=A0A0N4XG34_NIPBR|nr:unnamed protein product [Nippostrongylus brasiliensis]
MTHSPVRQRKCTEIPRDRLIFPSSTRYHVAEFGTQSRHFAPTNPDNQLEKCFALIYVGVLIFKYDSQ